jgi:hypothetical protein
MREGLRRGDQVFWEDLVFLFQADVSICYWRA